MVDNRAKMTRIDIESLTSVEREVKRLERQLDELESEMPGDIGAFRLKLNPAKTSTNYGIQEAIVDAIEMRERLMSMIVSRWKRALEIQVEIYEIAEKIKDPRKKEVLILRCIDNLSFDQIADQVHYSKRTVIRDYFRALADAGVEI